MELVEMPMGLVVSGGEGGTVAEEWHLVKIVVLWWVDRYLVVVLL